MNPLTWLIAAGLGAAVTASDATKIILPPDGSRVEVTAPAAKDASLTIRPLRGPALLGRIEVLPDRLVFRPTLPLLLGQRYRAEWKAPDGAWCRAEFEHPPHDRARPTVQMAPPGPLPANALKVYLHFSKPMEQGVFLHCLKLLDASGTEITGPFRETELWSPDGKRLTVWFHPGRQKTGVNLNTDEGPALRAGERHTLVVSGVWRDTTGIPLSKDFRFRFLAGPEDHESPALTTWKVKPPRAGSRAPLVVTFAEPLDPAMLPDALTVICPSGEALRLSEVNPSADGNSWTAASPEPWQPGTYELLANPLLEDLAGNSLARPFEVNLAEEAPGKRGFTLEWTVAP